VEVSIIEQRLHIYTTYLSGSEEETTPSMQVGLVLKHRQKLKWTCNKEKWKRKKETKTLVNEAKLMEQVSQT